MKREILLFITIVCVFVLIGCSKQVSKKSQPDDLAELAKYAGGTWPDLSGVNVSYAPPPKRSVSTDRTTDSAATMRAKPYGRTVSGSRQIVNDFSGFTPDMSFGEALDLIANSMEPPLNIFVNWRDLNENADIYRETAIEMNGMKGISARKAIELVLQSVSGGSGQIGYVVDGGVIVIATKEALPRNMVARVYDIPDPYGNLAAALNPMFGNTPYKNQPYGNQQYQPYQNQQYPPYNQNQWGNSPGYNQNYYNQNPYNRDRYQR